MSRYFILRDNEVVEEPDHAAWTAWYQSSFEAVREIARTVTGHGTIVTRFLPVSMTLGEDAQPLLFETRVAGGWLDGQGERFPTLESATAGHQSWVARVRTFEEENELPPPGGGW